MKRVVIKVGSHVLTQDGAVAIDRLRALVEFLALLHSQKKEVILVSSGAVAAGYTKIKLNKSKIEEKQALAAIGQPFLLREYQKEFEKYNILTAQVLLTAKDFDSRSVTAHAKAAVEALLKYRVIPIVNENDVTATEELLFGDNDRLSAHVAYYFDADILAILSDIDAYYDDDPKLNCNAKPKRVVDKIDEKELKAKFNPNNEFATGGIVTKLQAAKFLLDRDKEMYLASGFDLKNAKSFLVDGLLEGGTLFTKKERV
ncbi:MAG: glutamate 5-kinase [Epsilonproteobacteria bacterium]|nr:glutamate 5-kinase [Campylobacterota bacterium]